MSNTNKLHIAKKIKRARKEVGMSQKDLAKALKLTDKAISSYEVGRAMPSISIIQEISKLTYKPVMYFIEDSMDSNDLELQMKLKTIEKELSEIKQLLKVREELGEE